MDFFIVIYNRPGRSLSDAHLIHGSNTSKFYSSLLTEYTELNNTIDALNSYLDVWEERHRNLRAKVRAALVEGEADEAQESGSQEELKGVAVSGSMVSEHGLQDDSVTSSNSVDPASAVIQSTAKQSHDA